VQPAGQRRVGQRGEQGEQRQRDAVGPRRHAGQHPGPDHRDREEDRAGDEHRRAAQQRDPRGPVQQIFDHGVVQVEQGQVQGVRRAAEQRQADEVDRVRGGAEPPGGAPLDEVDGGQQRRRQRRGEPEDEAGRRGLAGERLDRARNGDENTTRTSASSSSTGRPPTGSPPRCPGRPARCRRILP
jgi:hypothetical protein